MRLLKKGGSTPCDRRLDRRKVALAAVIAALFLSATATHVIADTYVIDHSSSFLVQSVSLVDWPTGNFIGTTPVTFDPQDSFPGLGLQTMATPTGASDSAYLTGTINATVAAGAITLNTGSSIVPDTTGNYWPNHTGTTDPTGPFPGNPPVPGNFAYSAGVLGALVAMFNNMAFDFGQPAAPGSFLGLGPSFFGSGPAPLFTAGLAPSPMTLSGGTSGTFNLLGNVMSWKSGTISSFLNISLAEKSTDNVGGLLPVTFGDADMTPYTGLIPGISGNATGSLAAGQLTIPVSSQVGVIIDNNGGAGPYLYEIITYEGVIVANLVPEPSSMTLLGLGVVGLLSSAWRARKRKALAA